MTARSLLKDLDKYLCEENLYLQTSDQNESINISIYNEWKDKIEAALKVDFKRLFKTDMIDAVQKNSILTIEDPDEQSATIWKSFVELRKGEECLDVVIEFIVGHDFAFIHLGTSHTHLDAYQGSSIALRNLFDRLKQNEKIGNFHHTPFYPLFTDDALTKRGQWGISRWFRRWTGICAI